MCFGIGRICEVPGFVLPRPRHRQAAAEKLRSLSRSRSLPGQQDTVLFANTLPSIGTTSSFLFLVAMPGAPSSVLAPSSKARSP